jgi:ribosomal protein S18 acetylase RimI-like enzyme
MLQACDVGHRVVVRRRLPCAEPGAARLTDILGVLTVFDGEHLVVRTEDGVEHAVDLADVEAGKRIGPRPAKYSEIAALERVADRAWPAPVHERLGDWYLRSAEGWTNRANSALPLGDPGVPLEQAAVAVRDWYAARDLPPKITVPLPLRRDVADTVTGLGWTAQPVVLVQTAPITDIAVNNTTAEITTVENAMENLEDIALYERPSEDFLAIIRDRKASLPASSSRVLLDVPEVRFVEARGANGGLLAITRGAVVDDWLHIALVEVVPSARRRGLARTVYAALARWADNVGARRAFLQVEEQNEAAVTLYARQGFTTHHRYVTYRWDPGKG